MEARNETERARLAVDIEEHRRTGSLKELGRIERRRTKFAAEMEEQRTPIWGRVAQGALEL